MVISTQPAASAVAYNRIVAQMSKALKLAGRPTDAARLTAVSKNQPWEVIEPVLLAGHRTFGENRVQEAIERWEPVRDDVYSGLDLRLIGPLQSNKAEEAVGFFDVIETVDRDKIARAIADAAQKKDRCPRLFVQVNIGEEPQKAGILPNEADTFLQKTVRDYGLTIEGLMCIPPVDGPKGPYYALMQKIAARNGIPHLSYGMSDDFEVALRFGSDEIRVGTAIFGSR
ncbi:YggS family pyridoxal phosphate-dependent enzyme [Asticcacaulis sp. ZE23SCel15]|uniref:YggS family pyridoxal phosphate-dependent enzyme n=1 Tax=Asticcacaulis sp. ZE23SCel15 TaxID=3059027 RepID=UPI00265F2B06|nr:YggS family pyridoxal phosphate-dependent enzyme [Asticcacaulis sp. ZE23SCel15]WKL58283.1 YggS family pyridoxal phosphate-dependent enzyme [Asticcacaulis sp. ZE23SCel15]